MTSIVGILCTDGVVIGSDSSATFGPAPGMPTIEQRYDDKVQVVNNDIIIATTGQVGLAQRLEAVVEQVSKDRLQKPKSYADVAKAITTGALTDFQNTLTQKLELSAFAAYAVNEIHGFASFWRGRGFSPNSRSATLCGSRPLGTIRRSRMRSWDFSAILSGRTERPLSKKRFWLPSGRSSTCAISTLAV